VFRAASLWPAGLAILLYIVNNLSVWRGLLDPAPGYEGTGLNRALDVAQYATWVAAFQHDWLIPNYHAPWQTAPAFVNPLFLLLGKLAAITGMSIAAALHLAQFAGYCLAAYAVRAVLNAFCRSRWEARTALVVMALSAPLAAQAILALWWWPGLWERLPISAFVETGSDGLFRGTLQRIPKAYGAAAQLFAMAWLGRYLESGDGRYLRRLAMTILAGGMLHPHELTVMVPTVCLALLLRGGRPPATVLREIVLIGAAATLGASPYVAGALLEPWVRDASRAALPPGLNILAIVKTLGVPLILTLVLYPFRWRMAARSDLAIRCWYWVLLVGLVLPGKAAHRQALGSATFVIALLLVRQFAQLPRLQTWWAAYRPSLAAAGLLWCAAGLTAHGTIRYLSWEAGRQPAPRYPVSTVAPEGESDAIAWMRANASREHLVLAPGAAAQWFATVPMRSFASHQVFSINMKDQEKRQARFYAGKMPAEEAGQFLHEFGFRYVVAPADCPCMAYLAGSVERARFGRHTIHEFPGREMKPYPARPLDPPRP
jgi:hypothetical protein